MLSFVFFLLLTAAMVMMTVLPGFAPYCAAAALVLLILWYTVRLLLPAIYSAPASLYLTVGVRWLFFPPVAMGIFAFFLPMCLWIPYAVFVFSEYIVPWYQMLRRGGSCMPACRREIRTDPLADSSGSFSHAVP